MKSSYAKLLGALCCAVLAAASLTGCPPTPTGTVPNVVGMMQAAAETAITDALMTVGTVTEVFDDAPVGEVLSQDPAAGESVAEGTAIDLTVSKGPDLAAIQANFDLSQHGTREGKVTWWYGEEGEPGFSSLLEPDVDIAGCTSCHAPTYADGTEVDTMTYTPGCADCHADPEHPTAEPVNAPDVCKGCHGRQAKEEALAASPNEVVAARFTDVHKAAGMVCNDCHGFEEIHGDGNAYSSAYASPGADCEDCHVEGGPEGATIPPDTIPEHSQHTDTIACATCHQQTVIACYNCHIESLVDSHMKRANTALNGFVLLMNRVADGKVVPGSFQSASYQNKTMIAVGGFITHTITDEGRTCQDCHGNANVQAYNDTGEIVLGTWNPDANEGAGAIVGPSGVLPIPGDYKDAIKLDFLNFSEGVWSPTNDSVEPDTPDLVQMAPSLFTPMTPTQMQLLSTSMGGK